MEEIVTVTIIDNLNYPGETIYNYKMTKNAANALKWFNDNYLNGEVTIEITDDNVEVLPF